MQPDARDAAHLWDMLSAAREAFAIVDNVTMEQFLADRLRLRALERTFVSGKRLTRNLEL